MGTDGATPLSGTDILRLQNLTADGHGYPGRLTGVSFSVAAGEVLSVFAPGPEADILSSVLIGAIRPSGGQALICGADCCSEALQVRRRTVFVLPTSSMYGSMSVKRNVAFFARMGQVRGLLTNQQVEHALRRAAIPERSFERVESQIDPALRVRLWFAVAWLREPTALVVFEPTIGLDAIQADEVAVCLSEFRSANRGVLVVTSDAEAASTISDRILVLRDGRILGEEGRGESAAKRPATLYAEYLAVVRETAGAPPLP